MVEYIKKLIRGEHLTGEEAFDAMKLIMQGEAGEISTAGFLVALAIKGVTSEEIESFSKAMRSAAERWPDSNQMDIVDTCGTGGDSASLLNVSTITAFVIASMGYHVAKHGNRAVSSPTGSADVLEELGVRIGTNPDESIALLKEIGICFLFAPNWHPAMEFAAPVRRVLSLQAVFNILGPITNPAPITHQLMGVYDKRFLKPIAGALAGLGRRRALVVHSHDGLDEISIQLPTDYIKIVDGRVESEGIFYPKDFGIEPTDMKTLKVENRQASAKRVEQILKGMGTEVENRMVSVNAAAVLTLFNDHLSLADAYQEVVDHLKSGKAYSTLERWRSYSLQPIHRV